MLILSVDIVHTPNTSRNCKEDDIDEIARKVDNLLWLID